MLVKRSWAKSPSKVVIEHRARQPIVDVRSFLCSVAAAATSALLQPFVGRRVMRDWRLKHFINQCFRQLGPGSAGKFEPSILPHHLLATLFRYFQFPRHLLRLSGPGPPGLRRRAARAPDSWVLSAPTGTEPPARDRNVTAPKSSPRNPLTPTPRKTPLLTQL